MTTPTRHGATQDEWDQLTLILGLTTDLLPVVSNPAAIISPDSKMKDLGKTPSRYNGARQVAGIAKWTQHQATDAEVARWAAETDYGACIQTRRVRGIDVDVPDKLLSEQIAEFIYLHLGKALPQRERANTGKFLLAFQLGGQLAERVLKVNGGIIEFLANGQQFIACGTHPSGARYEWAGGLPDEFPVLSLEEFESLWAALDGRFSIAPATESKVSTKAERLVDAAHADPVAAYMFDKGLIRSQDRDGRLHIICPWTAEHSTETHDGDTSTTYWPAHTGGYINGHFKCLHAHCADRTDGDFKSIMGYVDEDDMADFEAIADEITETETIESEIVKAEKEKVKRFPVVPALEFSTRPAPTWIVKGVLPRAELVVVFGESGAGKSFFVLDLAGAIARGTSWQDKRTVQGRVVYVAAEGAGGFRNRLVAYATKEGITLDQVNLGVIASAPNLLEKADALDVARSIGRADVVIIDTFAQTTAGGNENSGEDVGKALAHCKGIHRATGATVLLVHHAGKDLTKGARGWSGLRAAADAQIEVSRQDPVRMLRMDKQKDGEDGQLWYFDLTQVPIGVDDDGDVITSCTMDYNVTPPVKQQGGPRLNQWETLIMASLTIIGEAQSAGIERKAVVNDALSAYKMGGGEGKNARDLLNRAVKSLSEKNYFVVEDDCIELLKGDL